MRSGKTSLLAFMLMLIAVIGCSKMIPGNADLFEGDNAAKAAAAIKKKAGTDKVNVVRAEIRPHVMKIVVQSPANPKEQDEYTFERGSVSGPEPVKIHNVFANFIPKVTEIDEINFAALPATIKQAMQIADPRGATVKLVSMDSQRASTANPQLTGSEGEEWALTWRIFVEGTRTHKYFWADKKGKLNETAY